MHHDDIAAFHRDLATWYTHNGRHDLPWRNTSDAYAIYVSEIMLQQTQVKTVLERFYHPFLEALPTLQALAEAPEQKVLSLWQGLGYYNRAINLHKTAQKCGDRLPSNAESLLELPGIGKNTAHAVLAFAFKEPVAILEANVKRVVSRIYAFKTPRDNELWEAAEALLNAQEPFDYNQAMMDLGSMICTPKTPNCIECPANSICQGKSDPDSYPEKKKKKAVPTRTKNILIVEDANGKVWAEPRKTRFLNGLNAFLELDEGNHRTTLEGVEISISKAQKLGSVQHTYSHFKLQADVYHLIIDTKMNGKNWHECHALKSLPKSVADDKAMQLFLSLSEPFSPQLKEA